MEYQIKTIGVLTSGGDAPGMNAAIRAVTRAAISNNIRVKAIYRGYKGLMEDEVKEFTTQDVSDIIHRGGTILKTARSDEFRTPEGRKRAYETLQKEQIDALIVIGGDGSFEAMTGSDVIHVAIQVSNSAKVRPGDYDAFGGYEFNVE